MRYALAVALLLILPGSARAQERADVPDLVAAGFDAYAAEGADAALDVWLQGWSAQDDAVARPQLRSVLNRLDEQAGAMLGYDVVGVAPWGERARRVYAVMLYQHQPVYARLDVYRAGADWKVVNVTVNTDPAQILPPELFVPRRPAP